MNKFLGLPDTFNHKGGDFSKLIESYRPMNVEVRNDGDAAVIDIDGFIGKDLFMEFITGEKSPNTVENLKDQLRAITENKIIVNINSPGGSLNDGIVIMDLLQAKDAEVITNLYGLSASAATIIWQGGTTRRISKNAFPLIHRVMYGLMGMFNSNSLLSMAEEMEPLDNRLIEIYKERSTSTTEEITELMDAGEGYGKFIGAEDALDMGLVDEIFDPADEEDDNVDRMSKTEAQNNALLDNLSLRNAIQNALAGKEPQAEKESGMLKYSAVDGTRFDTHEERCAYERGVLKSMKEETTEEEIQEPPEYRGTTKLKLTQMQEEHSNGLL